MPRYFWKLWFSSMFLLLLSSCGGDTVVVECNNTNSTVVSDEAFKVTQINVRSIGTATKKYEIDEAEANLSTTEQEDAFYAIFDGLELL